MSSISGKKILHLFMIMAVTTFMFNMSYQTGFAQLSNDSNKSNSTGLTVTEIPTVNPMGEDANGSSSESPGVLSGN
jgi:hypothetical protein